MPTVVVLHTYYGCDTGCCGHIVEIDGEQAGHFDFSHCYQQTPEAIRQFIIDMVTEQAGEDHVKDIDFENCIVSD